MNHYQVLEVSSSATTAEIKAAFRRKVKQVHPDMNPHLDEGEFIRLNEAYEILSDATTRNLYDLYLNGAPLVTVIEEVSPEEKYRAQYIRDRIRKQQAQVAHEVLLKQRVYRALRMINLMAFVAALFLSYDYYFASAEHSFTPEKVSQGRDQTTLHYQGALVRVSQKFYREYLDGGRGAVRLTYSAVLEIPIRVIVERSGKEFFVTGNLYVFRNGFSLVMFLFSIVVVGNRKYTDFRLTCGLVASFALLWVVLLVADYL